MPTIGEMLEKNAYDYPDEVALIELTPSHNSRKQITWKEFDQEANRVANYLIGKGIKKDNSINWIVAYFGIIKTGAWVVPFNYRFNNQDFKFCSDISKVKAAIFEECFQKTVQEVKPATITEYIYLGPKCPQDLTRFDEVLKTASSEALNIKLTPNDDCGLYFTSGTTGDPKPVLLTHRNMFRRGSRTETPPPNPQRQFHPSAASLSYRR
jgi:acyl-CoA synthetase (AMP-forming)/AMP-acid ligase II